MNFFVSLSNMSVVLTGIAVGYLANRLGILGGETDRKLTQLLLTITLPAMSLGAVASSEDLPDLAMLLEVLMAAAAFYLVSFTVAGVVSHLVGGTDERRGACRFALCFPNIGFIGIPVCTAFLGDEAMIYAVILTLPFNIISYGLGPMILTGGFKNFRVKELLNPAVVTSVAALFMTLLRFHPPELVGNCLNFVGDITVPLSLVVIGSLLAKTSLREVMGSPLLWGLAAVRLIVLPALLGLALRPLHLSAMAANVPTLQISMPVAANGSMLAVQYGGDQEGMARITFLTTLCSLVTVPVMARFLLV